MTYQIYIGSDNQTHRLNTAQIERIMAAVHSGFTLQTATGYWEGAREKTAVVTVTDTRTRVLATIARLKSELHQDAVAYQQVPPMRFV